MAASIKGIPSARRLKEILGQELEKLISDETTPERVNASASAVRSYLEIFKVQMRNAQNNGQQISFPELKD